MTERTVYGKCPSCGEEWQRTVTAETYAVVVQEVLSTHTCPLKQIVWLCEKCGSLWIHSQDHCATCGNRTRALAPPTMASELQKLCDSIQGLERAIQADLQKSVVGRLVWRSYVGWVSLYGRWARAKRQWRGSKRRRGPHRRRRGL